ncbi:mitochondrial MRF1 N(5)-glutamine methyltransferase Mtq1p [[Candida] railenensis]|uniref:peptide chain release factor N(5)-glutamine methyltransferase n=1 Tax=[Candida] railenensis TaxID=45579 RepID=A0A9P0QL68_9ASCO|nr:mitochondrial MRF1 N(5)-glutamine methyltransferase Mtq1p [[Candida] railenensis]
MARISPRLIKDAYSISPLLPYFLRANPNISLAKQELKWVQEELPQSEWRKAARSRHNLYPLQYILGSQPFGSLDIICKEKVLIPRPETEEWVLRLCSVLKESAQNLSIVDACTGTGCIALLAKHELKDSAKVAAFDISTDAYQLSMLNRDAHKLDVNIVKADLSEPAQLMHICSSFDLILSNPPYIPLSDYKLPVTLNGIEKSVRKFEPKSALVGEMEFYDLLVQNLVRPFGASGFVFELGYREQAEFIRKQFCEEEWGSGILKDYSGNVRCSIGWKRGSNLDILERLCDEVL